MVRRERDAVTGLWSPLRSEVIKEVKFFKRTLPPSGRVSDPAIDVGFFPSRAVSADFNLGWKGAFLMRLVPGMGRNASDEIEDAFGRAACHRDPCCPSLSRTSRTARSRTSGENLFVVLLMMLLLLRSWSLRQTRRGSHSCRMTARCASPAGQAIAPPRPRVVGDAVTLESLHHLGLFCLDSGRGRQAITFRFILGQHRHVALPDRKVVILRRDRGAMGQGFA
ncbi:hypothetical protein SAMN04488021_15612 [Paracoccus aminovorans]|uniref:Uncharacterized protein n=1 Tax=Paracoccus aminovorans TaxID=34004 RepID=A0A1I3EXF7_9RHOB|nr:hypothetical protein JCM7685_2226 [Paracoccus aminovorans]SFI03679.1 hypothetical protein SAMN04488021_15612 [Paracoccus aminovorans]